MTNLKMKSEGEELPPWANSLWNALGLEGVSAEEIYHRTDEYASRLAPNTRRLWRSILLLEGMAVLAPLLWMVAARSDWSPAGISVIVATVTLGLVGLCWWLRWKQQQHLWSRSRLVAEIARSRIATKDWDFDLTRDALFSTPSLQPLVSRISQEEVKEPVASDEESEKAKIERYVRDRIDDQLAFFEKASQKAATERQQLSKYVTRALDAALVLAVLGLWLGFSGVAQWLLSVSGGDLVLGFSGALFPMIVILMQSLSSYLELNRRTGRYAQQWEFLHTVRAQFHQSNSVADYRTLIWKTESALLSEVTEWFFQTEHAESFYRSAISDGSSQFTRDIHVATSDTLIARVTSRILSRLGIMLGVTGRIVFGRVLIIAITSILTALLIISGAPRHPGQKAQLRTADGRLLSNIGEGGEWRPRKQDTENGFVLIAHGLRDSPLNVPIVRFADQEGKPHWMTQLKEDILKASGKQAPDICLVDWGSAAKPSEVNEFLDHFVRSSKDNQSVRFVEDVVAIRAQAQEIGDLVGLRLARAILVDPNRKGRSESSLRNSTGTESYIRGDRPMHLIGHSAGGFLVVRAACVLQDMGLLPEITRVTLLDTPLPDNDDIKRLLADGRCQMDFYKSSELAKNVPNDQTWNNYRSFDLIRYEDGKLPSLTAHSFAWYWYIQTVNGTDRASADLPMGFRLSPFWQKD